MVKKINETTFNLVEKKKSVDKYGVNYNKFLASIEKHRRKWVFIPEQPTEYEIIWFSDCLQDVILILNELNNL